jgi:hypothetical protein
MDAFGRMPLFSGEVDVGPLFSGPHSEARTFQES